MSYDAPYLRQVVLEAASEGDLNGIIQALDDGSSIPDLINSVDTESGFTALHYACQKGYVEIVCFLLRHGAAIHVLCQFKKTPIHYACHFGHEQVVYVLLDSPRVNIEKLYYLNEAKLTHLQTAAAKGYLTIVQLLLLYGDVVDGVNELGETALHLASAGNHLDIVRLLLRCGACLIGRNPAGDTALHYACRSGSIDVATFLVQEGISIHIKNFGVAPCSSLEIARTFGHSILANRLIEASQRVRARVSLEDDILVNASVQAFEAAKKEYFQAKEITRVQQEQAKRTQIQEELTAIHAYLRDVKNGKSIQEANQILERYPRLSHGR